MQLNAPFRVDVHDRVPIGGFHAYQQSVPGDAGVVHQHVDPAGVLYNGTQIAGHSTFRSNIHLLETRVGASGFDAFGRGFGRLQISVVIKIDSRSRSAKSGADSSSDAP
jgi:hypothetical protein